MLREPVIVQPRRARMHHRKSHDAGEQEAIGVGHDCYCTLGTSFLTVSIRGWGCKAEATAEHQATIAAAIDVIAPDLIAPLARASFRRAFAHQGRCGLIVAFLARQ